MTKNEKGDSQLQLGLVSVLLREEPVKLTDLDLVDQLEREIVDEGRASVSKNRNERVNSERRPTF